MAVALHAGDDVVQQLRVCVGFVQRMRIKQTGVQIRSGLYGAGKCVILVEDASVDHHPVQRALVAQALHVLLGEIAEGALQLHQHFALAHVVAQRDFADDPLLKAKTVFQCLRHFVVGKAHFNDAQRARKIADIDQPLDVLGQRIGKVSQIRQHDGFTPPR